MQSVNNMDDLESYLAVYLEHLWETGASMQLFGDALSGLPHFIPAVRGLSFSENKKLLSLMIKRQVPTRSITPPQFDNLLTV